MSRNVLSNEKKSKNKANIFHTEETDLNLSKKDSDLSARKSSKRHASQGVQLLVDREKRFAPEINCKLLPMSGSEIKRSNPGMTHIIPHINQSTVKNNTLNSLMNTSINNISISSMNIPGTISSHLNYIMPSNNINQIQRQTPIYTKKDDKILNKINFEKLLIDKIRLEGLEVKSLSEITNFMNIGLENYMKNVIEKLISISRIRNVNLNLYSKQSEKNPVFKIHTFNNNLSGDIRDPNISYPFYKDFSILFTKNMKNTISMMEQYEELTFKKMRQEKVSMYKSKLEEITQLKEKEREIAMDSLKDSSVVAKPKLRVRKRDNMLKSVKNTLAKSQKRDEMAKHKKETQNTLETFLDGRIRPSTLGPTTLSHSVSGQRFEAEMISNFAESHNMETYTKFSEVSKSELPIDASGNDINLSIFKYSQPSQNAKLNISSNVRRRITIKDLIHFLEGERKTPLQNLILHKAILKLNQYSH